MYSPFYFARLQPVQFILHFPFKKKKIYLAPDTRANRQRLYGPSSSQIFPRWNLQWSRLHLVALLGSYTNIQCSPIILCVIGFSSKWPKPQPLHRSNAYGVLLNYCLVSVFTYYKSWVTEHRHMNHATKKR
jgi:hypothetical protein